KASAAPTLNGARKECDKPKFVEHRIYFMNKLAWGLIGCGDIARKRIARALRDLDECDLIAVSRQRKELAESFAKEFGARKWYAAWEDLLKDDDVAAVYIATPVFLHAAQTIA